MDDEGDRDGDGGPTEPVDRTLWALGHTRDPAVIPTLVVVIDDEPLRSSLAIESLARLGVPEAVEALRTVAARSDEAGRHAMRALVEVGTSVAPIAPTA